MAPLITFKQIREATYGITPVSEQPTVRVRRSPQPIIEEPISTQNIHIPDNLSAQSLETQLSADGELLCTSFRQSDPEVVPVRVHDEIICDVTYPFETEKDPKFTAEIVIAADVAQDLSAIPETSTIVSGGTSMLIISSLDSSILETGGASLISTQELPASSDGASPKLSTTLLDSTPPFLNPTSTSGGTSTGASSADTLSILCFSDNMPLLPPRTGIGVQDQAPPPTACPYSRIR